MIGYSTQRLLSEWSATKARKRYHEAGVVLFKATTNLETKLHWNEANPHAAPIDCEMELVLIDLTSKVLFAFNAGDDTAVSKYWSRMHEVLKEWENSGCPM